MARKFFNQKVKKSKSKNPALLVTLILIGVIATIILIVLIVKSLNKKPDNAVIKIRDVVAVEINSELPDKTIFFAELENVKEKDIKVSFENVKVDTVGKYEVTLKVYGKSYKSTLEVVDTESPKLEAKDHTIRVGDTYTAKDFVKSCTDNSGISCIVEFYDKGLNQEGDKLSYSNYVKEGTYTVQIIAKDPSGNTSYSMAKLVIGSGQAEKPTTCKYGNDSYDKDTYTIAVNVTENGCALDLNLYQSETILAPIKDLIEAETAKLKKEMNVLKLDSKNIYLNSSIGPVLNESGKGVVGYTVYMEVYLGNDDNKEVIESFYVNQYGGRNYIVNKYLK